jgi:hypothetical protein
MNSPTPISPALQLLTWPLQLAQLSAQAFQAALPRLAPDALAQTINPWTAVVNINSNNSTAPDTEQSVVARHSYGRQLGRMMDVVGLLVDDLQSRACTPISTTSRARRPSAGWRESPPTWSSYSVPTSPSTISFGLNCAT